MNFEEEYYKLAAHVERINEIVERMERKGELWEEHTLVLTTDETPATSLARLKAQWQAEALDLAAERLTLAVEADTVRAHLRNQARKLRRQAEEVV